MNDSAYIDIQFKGKNLSPSTLAEKIKLPIETLVSSGDLGKVGRYRGKPMPYGIGLLKINPDVEAINKYSDILIKNKAKLKKYNVDEIIFDVDANSEELEKFSISSTLLKKLSSIDAKIQFYNHEIAKDDFSVLLDKIMTKVSTLTYPNNKKIRDFFQTTASSIDTVHIKPEYIYAMVISYLENSQGNKRITKKTLAKAAQEFDKI